MRLRITIINDDSCELYATHQFTEQAELEALKDMATLADLTWDGDRFNADNCGPGSEVKSLLDNIVEAVEAPDV